MKAIATLSACAFLAIAAPAAALAQSGTTTKDLKMNGSPSGPSPSHADVKGDRGTESGPAPKATEGRSSASDSSQTKTNSPTTK